MKQDMELSVEFSAEPKPTVTWYKDDEEVVETPKVM